MVILDVVVLIPALNPDDNILRLVNDLHKLNLKKIVIVNDGSDIACLPIFETLVIKYGCNVISHKNNEGKGAALKTGVTAIKELYPNCVGFVTADADGQHLPEDILHVAQELTEKQDSFILGVRDFNKNIVPFKSRYGNKITSFVFFITTGKRCSDTQTGLRGFPIQLSDNLLQITGTRFEYEMNMLIELAKNRIEFNEVPIETVYADGNRKTHFRPVKDSILIYGQIFKQTQFLKFILSSLLSALFDISLFTLFRITLFAPFVQKIIYSTIIARILSGIFNYTINKEIVFRNKEKSTASAIKYTALFLIQMILSAVFVDLLANIKIGVTVIKLLIDSMLFIISFLVQKSLVFRKVK